MIQVTSPIGFNGIYACLQRVEFHALCPAWVLLLLTVKSNWDVIKVSGEEHCIPGGTSLTRNCNSSQMQAGRQSKWQSLQFSIKPTPYEEKVEHETCGFVTCAMKAGI